MTLLNEYLRERFGCKVYKVSINAGLTCPNRDGKLGTRANLFEDVQTRSARYCHAHDLAPRLRKTVDLAKILVGIVG